MSELNSKCVSSIILISERKEKILFLPLSHVPAAAPPVYPDRNFACLVHRLFEAADLLQKCIREYTGKRVTWTHLYKDRLATLDTVYEAASNRVELIVSALSDQIKHICKADLELVQRERMFAKDKGNKKAALPRNVRIASGELLPKLKCTKFKSSILEFALPLQLSQSHKCVLGQAVRVRWDSLQDIGSIVRLTATSIEVQGNFTNSRGDVGLVADVESITSLRQFNSMNKALKDVKNLALRNQYDRRHTFGIELAHFLLLTRDPENIALIQGIRLSRIPPLAPISYFKHPDSFVSEDFEQPEPSHMHESYEKEVQILAASVRLNPSQREAILASLNSRFSLIQGPPGTGKTHTSAALVKAWQLKHPDKQVVVVAQSNKGLDQLAMAIDEHHGLDVVRIGFKMQSNIKTEHLSLYSRLKEMIASGIQPLDKSPFLEDLYPSLRKCSQVKPGGYAETGYSEKDLIQAVIHNADVICCTCMGSADNDLISDTEDRVGLVLIDEASQATEPQCLVPLMRFPKAKIVLIGDHCQLPPTIASAHGGHDNDHSLFQRLTLLRSDTSAAHSIRSIIGIKWCMSTLHIQYRMHPVISAYVNKHFYRGQLVDGVTAEERPLVGSFPWPTSTPLDGSVGARMPVAFIPVDGVEQRGRGSNSPYNQDEIDVVSRVVQILLSSTAVSDIAVISPYAAQVAKLSRSPGLKLDPGLDTPRGTRWDFVEVNSVDGFQGSEREVVIVSTVRANGEGKVGFLKDWRRMNVALSRARRGLVVVGNRNTLREDPHWCAWVDHYEGLGCIVDPDSLPAK